MRTRSLMVMLSVLALPALGACEGSGTPVEAAGPARVAVVDGNAQEVLSGNPLPEPLRVRVTDEDGQPLAGVSVRWWATGGTFSADETVTDASGVAAVTWIMRKDANTAPLGKQRATATVEGVAPAEFSGYSAWGITVESVAFSTSEVDVASGPATVTVSVRATSDIGNLLEGGFRFIRPSGEAAPSGRFTLASGTGKDGIWQGTMPVPQGAEPGTWKLEFTLRSDHTGMSWFWENMSFKGMPYGFTVKG